MQPPSDETSNIRYHGAGWEEGECGMSIRSVDEKHNGNITCALVPFSDSKEITGNIQIVVACKYLEYSFTYLLNKTSVRKLIGLVVCLNVYREEKHNGNITGSPYRGTYPTEQTGNIQIVAANKYCVYSYSY